MTDNFGPYLAEQIADWLFDDTDIDAAPGSVYVALFDADDDEVTGDFANGRVEMPPGDWNRIDDTQYENDVDIDFGEASTDVTDVESVALYDASSTGDGNELVRGPEEDAPFDVSSGTTFTIQSGDLTVDVLEFSP